MSNQLSLRIKRQYLDEIIAGIKKSEFRACNDFYADRLGVIEGNEVVGAKQFDRVRFYTGEKKDSAFAVVECKGVFINIYEDDKPEWLGDGDMVYEIELGEVIEHNLK